MHKKPDPNCSNEYAIMSAEMFIIIVSISLRSWAVLVTNNHKFYSYRIQNISFKIVKKTLSLDPYFVWRSVRNII